MRLKTLTSALACALSLSVTPVFAESEVVATIQPIHSLVSSVMKGVGEPGLLIDKTMSPHTMSLKPSQAKELQNAKIIFWVGDELETPLAKPIETIGEKARVVELVKADGIKLLDFRKHEDLVPGDHDHDEGHDDHKDDHAHEEGHDHDGDKDHDHDKDHAHKDDHDHKADAGDDDHKHDEAHEHKDDHDHGKHDEDEHDHAKHDEDEHDHAGHDDHEGHHHHHDGTDPHIWLSTNNAIAITRSIEKNLSEVFPESAEVFAKNADETVAKLETLTKEIPAKLHADHARPFLVFHDAYHYFEDQFGFQVAGVVNLSPASAPGAKHLSELREAVKNNKVACIYTEPQFSTKMAESIAEGTDIKLAKSDPLGADLETGPDQYFQLINNLADSFAECFEH